MTDQQHPESARRRGRPANHERWFNASDAAIALETLHTAQRDMDELCTEPWHNDWPFETETRAHHNTHFGQRNMMWAIMLLWRHTSDKVLKPVEFARCFLGGKRNTDLQEFAAAILSEVTSSKPANYDQASVQTGVQNLIKATAARLVRPNAPLARQPVTDVVNKIQAALTDPAAQVDTETAYYHLVAQLGLAGSYTAPEGTSRAVQPLQLPPPEPVLEDLNDLPEGIVQYLSEDAVTNLPNSRDITKLGAETLFGKLSDMVRPKRIAILTGPPHAGKTAVLVSFLRRLDPKFNGTARLNLNDDGHIERLPVLMLNAQRFSYRDLLMRTLAFLRRLADPSMSAAAHLDQAQADFPQRVALDNVSDILNEIRDLHAHDAEGTRGHPAVFIFTDWQDFAPDQNRIVLRDAPRANLIELLIKSNPLSRVVLSALPDVAKVKIPRNMPRFFIESMEHPDFKEILRYFEDERTVDRTKEPWKSVFRDNMAKKIPGDILLLAAATYQLCANRPEVQTLVVEALGRFCALIREEKTEGAEDELISILLNELKARKVLGMFFVVAASDDGVRRASLERIFDQWSRENYAKDAPTWDTRIATFEALKDLAIRFFVKYEPCTNYDPREYDIGEEHKADDRVWEVDIAIASRITDAMYRAERGGEDPHRLTVHADLLRDARRQLANFVRWRARTRRLHTSTIAEPRNIRLMRRDMQCHEALLASIPPQAFDGQPDFAADAPIADLVQGTGLSPKLPRLLSISEDIVFSTNTQVFQPQTALRYALLQILRREIDHDHELSMLYDFDLIRLRLYLLTWLPLGRRYGGSVDEIWDVVSTLPADKIPDQIRASFTPTEIIELLTTIALASYHSQRPAIIDWARGQFELLLDHYAPADDPDALPLRRKLLGRGVRIYCSILDSRIQTGGIRAAGTFCDETVDQTHYGTLAMLRSWLEAHYDDYEAVAGDPKALAALSLAGFRRCKAWMRLKAREAEVLSLLATDQGFDRSRPEIAKAHEIYSCLVAAEEAIAKPASSKTSVIFSGRTARRYIRFLIRSQDYAVPEDNPALRDAVDSAICSLIDINIARLRHYGGADQVCAFIDRSMYTYSRVTKHTDADQAARWKDSALSYAEEALELCRQGNASHAIELEVLQILIAQTLEKIQVLGEAGTARRTLKPILDKVCAHLERAELLAGQLDFLPSLGVAQYLRAKCKYVSCLVEKPRNVDDHQTEMVNKLDEARESLGRVRDISFAREITQLYTDIHDLDERLKQMA